MDYSKNVKIEYKEKWAHQIKTIEEETLKKLCPWPFVHPIRNENVEVDVDLNFVIITRKDYPKKFVSTASQEVIDHIIWTFTIYFAATALITM